MRLYIRAALTRIQRRRRYRAHVRGILAAVMQHPDAPGLRLPHAVR